MSNQITLAPEAIGFGLSVLNLIGATFLVWFCWRELRRINSNVYDLEAYSFYNRTEGGTIKFRSFDIALQHRARRQGAVGNLIALCFIGPVSLVWFFNAAGWLLKAIS